MTKLIALITDEDLELALNGRVCDPEDTIDIAEWRGGKGQR